MSDNELDNLFKEAADGFKAPRDPSAWDAMSKRLDSAGVGTSGFWNWKTISTVSVVGITGLASILYFAKTEIKSADEIAGTPNSLSQSNLNQLKETKPVNTETAVVKAAESTSTSAKNSSAIESGQTTNSTKPDEKALVESSEKKNDNTTQNDEVTTRDNPDRNRATRKSPDLAHAEIKNESDPKPIQSNLSDTKESSDAGVSDEGSTTRKDGSRNETQKSALSSPAVVQTDNTPLASDQKSVKQQQGKEVIENVAVPDRQKGNQVSKKSDASVKSDDVLITSDDASVAQIKKQSADESRDISLAKDSVEITKEDVAKEELGKDSTPDTNEEPSKEKVSQKGIAIKLAIAPDYSSVKRSSPNGLGYSYGLLVQYRFNEHWSVATGGIWEKKIYSAEEVEYKGYTADKVDGDCRMWDIPLNVYYSFLPTKKFSFYAGLGFSSYIMNKENYVMHYEGSYGTYDYPVEVKGENNEWFKTLNVSLGIQLRVNRIVSFQFEPTLKAPLAGVGEGEVSLLSFGAFLNARFDIPMR